MKIDQNLIDEFDKNGAVCLRGVFEEKWIDTIRKGIEKNLVDPSSYSEFLKGTKGDGYYFDDYCNWKRIPEFYEYVFESPAAAIAGILVQSKTIAFYHEHVLVKEPGADKATPWHHDQSYYPIDGEKACSIWMPVDEVPLETTINFVAGSHKWGWFQPIKFATTLPYKVLNEKTGEKVYNPVPDIEANKDKYNILCWSLKPGDCIVFHMKTLHGAPGNSSLERSRRVLSTRWLGDDAVLAERPWDISPPVVGGLNPGDKVVSSKSNDFPVVWRRED